MSRSAVDWRTASKDNYIAFKKDHPEIDLDFDDWKLIIYRYMDLFRDELLETGEKRRLPAGFGEFAVSKKKKKKIKIRPEDNKQFINLSIDWKKTKEKGKRIYHFNYDTEGFSFYWKWFKLSARFRFWDLWYFKPSRVTSRMITHYVRIDEEYQHKYCEWES